MCSAVGVCVGEEWERRRKKKLMIISKDFKKKANHKIQHPF